MTENEEKRAMLMHESMLNQRGLSALSALGIYKDLVLALSLQDLEMLHERCVYFNPMFSPASQMDLNIRLEAGSKIITIDVNSLKGFTVEEGVAIILHEIGHALNADLKGEIGEYAADDYARARNYGNAIVSSLAKGMRTKPELFRREITQKRIDRLSIVE